MKRILDSKAMSSIVWTHVKRPFTYCFFPFLAAANNVTYLHFIYSRFKDVVGGRKAKSLQAKTAMNVGCFKPVFCWQTITVVT